MPVCFVCKENFAVIKQLTFHYSLIHRLNYDSKVFKCAEAGCFEEFEKLYSLTDHLATIHKFPRNVSEVSKRLKPPSSGPPPKIMKCEASVSGISSEEMNQEVNDPNLEFENSVDPFTESSILNNQSEKLDPQSRALVFVSNLYANPSLPRNCVQNMVENCSDLFSSVISYGKARLNSLHSQVSKEALSEIHDILSKIQNPFQNLETEYKRMELFKKLGTFIQPQPIYLGTYPVDKKIDGAILSVDTPVYGQYISAPKLLFNFFSQVDVLRKTLDYMNSLMQEKTCLTNVVQGQYWRRRFENCGKIVIPLYFYVDAFEVGNPLGSHAGLHKISGGYLTVACIPPEYSSSLNNIFVTLLFNADDRKTFGNEKVFKPLIKDLKELHDNGLSFNTSTFSGKVYFALANLLGDNLGNHEITDFACSFMAKFPCLWCKATKEETKTLCVEKKEKLRNSENYKEDAAKYDVSLTGIHKPSVWNQVPSFEVIYGASCDLMHDCAEGVGPYIMLFVIKHYLQNKFFTLNTLNFRLKNFDYGPITSNKPPLISENDIQKSKIKASSAEMLNLVRYFSLIIGDLIPEGDKVWNLYLNFKQLLELLLAPSLQRECSDLIEYYVKEVNVAYLELSGETLKNKFHHLTHYPRLFLELGPSVKNWVIRLEGGHRLSKLNANVVMSRVNPSCTLSINSQLNFQSRLLSDKFMDDTLEYGMYEIVPLSLDLQNFSTYLCNNNLLKKYAFKVSWVVCHGTRYSAKMVLIYDISENIPDFAKIMDIYVIDDKLVFFKCSKLEVIDISPHFGCYEIQPTDELILLNQNDLIDPIPTCISLNAVGTKFVTLKHSV